MQHANNYHKTLIVLVLSVFIFVFQSSSFSETLTRNKETIIYNYGGVNIDTQVLSRQISNTENKYVKFSWPFPEALRLYDNRKIVEANAFLQKRGVKITNGRVDVKLKVINSNLDEIKKTILQLGGKTFYSYKNLIHASLSLEVLKSLMPNQALITVEPLEHLIPADDGYQVPSPTLSQIQTLLMSTGAKKWHEEGFKGKGISVGIIDIGFRDLELLKAEGALPTNTVLINHGAPIVNQYENPHGSLVAQIVHQLAPEAKLYLLRTGFGGITSFMDIVAKDKSEMLDIAITSLSSLVPPFDGTSPVSKHIDEILQAKDFPFIVCAGNMATSHWEGYFSHVDGTMIWPTGSKKMNFETKGGEVHIVLTWNDWALDQNNNYSSGNKLGLDYKMIIYKKGESIPYDTIDTNQMINPNYNPQELVYYGGMTPGSYEIEIVANNIQSQSNVYLDFTMYFGYGSMELESVNKVSSIPTYADITNAITVGAYKADTFELEDYSGRGPINSIGNGPPEADKIKPEIVAPLSGFFSGTSAAAPVVAGVSALIMQRDGIKGAKALREKLLNEYVVNLPNYKIVPNNDMGYGAVNLSEDLNEDLPDTVQFSPALLYAGDKVNLEVVLMNYSFSKEKIPSITIDGAKIIGDVIVDDSLKKAVFPIQIDPQLKVASCDTFQDSDYFVCYDNRAVDVIINTGSKVFTVKGSVYINKPKIASFFPIIATPGSNIKIDVYGSGSHFNETTKLYITSYWEGDDLPPEGFVGDISISDINIISPGHLTAMVEVSPDAVPSMRNLGVSTLNVNGTGKFELMWTNDSSVWSSYGPGPNNIKGFEIIP